VKDGQEAFKVVPSEVTIPPHEHRYAEVTFSPTQLQEYVCGCFDFSFFCCSLMVFPFV
jgi:hypothetical protein